MNVTARRRPVTRRYVAVFLQLATVCLMVATIYEAWASGDTLVNVLAWLTLMIGVLILATFTVVGMFLEAIDTTARRRR